MDYTKVISKKAQSIEPSGIRKFFDIAADMEDCVSLGIGGEDI